MSGLRGIFLTSEDPAAAARFYQDVAKLKLEKVGSEGGYVYWKIDEAAFNWRSTMQRSLRTTLIRLVLNRT